MNGLTGFFSQSIYRELLPRDLREANYNQSNFLPKHSTWPRLVGCSHRGKYLIPLCLFYTLWHHNNLGFHDSTCHTTDVLRQLLWCRKSHDTCKRLTWWLINTNKSSNFLKKNAMSSFLDCRLLECCSFQITYTVFNANVIPVQWL